MSSKVRTLGIFIPNSPSTWFFPYSFRIFISPFITYLLIQALFLSLHPCRFESRCRKPWLFFFPVVKFIAMWIILHFHLYLSHLFPFFSFLFLFSLSLSFFVSFSLPPCLSFCLYFFYCSCLLKNGVPSSCMVTIQICTTAIENCNNKASQFEKLLNATKTWK